MRGTLFSVVSATTESVCLDLAQEVLSDGLLEGSSPLCKRRSSHSRVKVRVLHYSNLAWNGHRNTHGIPWHPRGTPWCGVGFHGTPWEVLWQATGGTMETPAAAATALHGNPTECHDNPHGTPMFTAPRLGLGMGLGFRSGVHGMRWRSAEGSVVYRGRCRGRCS